MSDFPTIRSNPGAATFGTGDVGQGDGELKTMGGSTPPDLPEGGKPKDALGNDQSPEVEKPKTPSGNAAETVNILKGLLASFGASASPGAAIMALLTQNSAEQRRVNKEIKATAAESIAKTMETQADEMRSAAVTQLVLGVVAGAITVLGGAFAAVKAGGALGAGLSPEAATLTNLKLSAQQTASGGVASILGAVSDYIGTTSQADIKDKDADIERTRATIETLKDFDDALTEMIRKCISTAEAMQESSNQARAKILA
jgi:hypothetical protein